MKNVLIIAAIAATSALNAQSFVAGWDFDSVALDAQQMTSNWGDESGSALLSWTHSPAGGPPFFTPAEFGLGLSFNSGVVNNSFTFLTGGVDANTGFDQFSDNFGAAEQGFEALSTDTFSFSFNASGYESLQLFYAYDATGSGTYVQETVNLSTFDGNAAALYQFNTVSGARYDNFAITGTAVPEPSTFAAIAGVLALGFTATRRRR
ncbi:MAG: PEP-CTERM sorting domain-containing protein [Opitutales bacterium]|nr:PEP-CTERM sorting domain-containing protein [Opitutales bacterium]